MSEESTPVVYDPKAKYGTDKNPFRGVYSQSPRVTPNYLPGAYPTDMGSLRVARLYLSTGKDALFLAGGDIDSLLRGTSYAGFFLQQVAEQHSERAEVVQLPGDSYAAYFFGSAPSTYTFSGTFLNTQEDQWRVLFKWLYMGALRGTENAKQRHLVQIAYDTKIVSGYITGFTDVLKADNELFSSFQFTMLVKAEHLALERSAITGSDSRALEANVSDFTDFATLAEANAARAAKYAVTAYVDVPPKARQRRGTRLTGATCIRGVLTDAGTYRNGPGSSTAAGVSTASRPCTAAENRKLDLRKVSKLKAKLKKAAPKDKAPLNQKLALLTAQLKLQAASK